MPRRRSDPVTPPGKGEVLGEPAVPCKIDYILRKISRNNPRNNVTRRLLQYWNGLFG
jgi:hypothetical protein